MNKEIEILVQLKYWEYITDWQGAKNLLIRLNLISNNEAEEIDRKILELDILEEKANQDYKEMREREENV